VGAAVRPLTGSIDARSRAIDEQSARLADRIADVDARLDKKRQNLLAQYAKFEAALGRMKAVGDSMSAQFTGLLNSNKNS
jgi:flagellar capping protein FliD